jgi:hypothetical protein
MDFSLCQLHPVLQIAMGWQQAHLYEYIIGHAHFADKHSTHMKLGSAVTAGRSFTYRYDFGDDWQHDVVVERVLPAEVGVLYPVCLAGDGACPPEDSGGVERYLRRFVEPLHLLSAEPLGEDGGDSAPGITPFCLADVNQALWRWVAETRPRRTT